MLKTHKASRLLLAALCGAAIGGGVVGALMPAPEPNPTVTCRPTLPARAHEGPGAPVLLLWGNSLLFDHGWQGTAARPVNCARQGQTAQAARPLTADLPVPPPDTVLLAFGSVEAVQAVNTGRAPDLDGFGEDMTGIVATLSTRWPEARIVIAALPPFQEAGVLRPEDIAALNAVLSEVADQSGTLFLDLAPVFPAGAGHSYDGIHIAPRAYALWDAALAELIGTE